MKNGLLAWNVVLTIIAGYLLFAHLSNKGEKIESSKVSARDTTTGPVKFRIAYFEMDSVESNLELVKAVKAEIGKKEDEFNNKAAEIDYIYQKRMQEYYAKAPTMAQAELEKEQGEIKQLEQTLKMRRQELEQTYQSFVMQRNLNVKKRIEDFLSEYNKSKNYSYIVSYEPGLFYYKDTIYNITNDLIRGMNLEYKNKKQ